MLRTRSVAVAVCTLICLAVLSKSVVAEPPEARAESPASCAAARKLTKLPEVFGTDVMESAPLVYKGRPMLLHSRRTGGHNVKMDEMYLYLVDLETGKEVARLAKHHSFGSVLVDGDRMHVFATEYTEKDWTHDICRFSSTDLKSWTRELAIAREGGEHLFNTSVCRDEQGFLMAYESNLPVGFCFKFARSKDLVKWEKIDGLVFTGVGNEYSACPVVRYFKPYYYVIYLHAPIAGHNGYISFVARSKDLVTWQLSPQNPILEAGQGEGRNNSDVDLVEIGGETYVYYATGDQQTWMELKRARYPGPMAEFFQSYFPADADMTEVSTKP